MTTEANIDEKYNQAMNEHDRGTWVHTIALSSNADGVWSVNVESNYGGGRSLDLHNNIDIELGYIPDGAADTRELRDYLATDGAELLRQIIDGYDTVFDGQNVVGKLNESAAAAHDQVLDAICRIEYPMYIFAGDYYLDLDGLGVTPSMTDDEVEELAEQCAAADRANGQYVDLASIMDLLTEHRDQLAEEDEEG